MPTMYPQKNNEQHESVPQYSLRQLFEGDNKKIVIPDLQRDYCWGGSSLQLVPKFLDSLFLLFKEHRDTGVVMGILYGYKDELTQNIQLCDGQQRLTTFFLLLGVINRHLGGETFRNLLISDFEYDDDDQEPYLQYSIRESSLYFLSDLTVHYFIKTNEVTSYEQLKARPWYLAGYREDPTIQSIFKAIGEIEESLMQQQQNDSLFDLQTFGEFISEKLKFLYYDMGNRDNGEETFVVINTTGEPLTANENLKPLFIAANKDCNVSNQWEEMETWFWQHRKSFDFKKGETAAQGMMAFFKCVDLLYRYKLKTESVVTEDVDENDEKGERTYKDRYPEMSEHYSWLTSEGEMKIPYQEIPFSVINDYFVQYKKLYDIDYSQRGDEKWSYKTNSRFEGAYTQETYLSLLPLLYYAYRFPEADVETLQRFYHLFKLMSEYRDKTRPFGPTVSLLNWVDQLQPGASDTLDLIKTNSKKYTIEIDKLLYIQNAIAAGIDRNVAELRMSTIERHPIFSQYKKNCALLLAADHDFQKLDRTYSYFDEIWPQQGSSSDDVRRFLLYYGYPNYPYRYSGSVYSTLCDGAGDWQQLLYSTQEALHSLLQERDGYESWQSMVDQHIANPKDVSLPLATIRSDTQLLEFSKNKQLVVYPYSIDVLEKKNRNGDYRIVINGVTYAHWYKSDQLWTEYFEGKVWSSRISNNNLQIDFTYNEEDDSYKLTLRRSNHEKQSPLLEQVPEIFAEEGFKEVAHTEGYMKYVLSGIKGHQEMHDLFIRIRKELDKHRK